MDMRLLGLTSPMSLPSLMMQFIGLSENGIAVLSAENRFIYHNRACARMFGFDEHSLTGQSHDDFMRWMYVNQRGVRIDWPTLEAWLDHVRCRHRSEPFRSFEVDLVDGRWLLVSEQVYPRGEMVILCTDITLRKQTELALQKARDDLERLALTDELTGLPNRRNFLQQLEQELAKAERHDKALCLAMLDIDHFKQVNDRFGHAIGDEVLRHFAGFLRSQLRAGDVLGRLGGEEFGLLLPETGMADALSVLDRAISGLAGEYLPQVASDFRYGFSAGVVQLSWQGPVAADHLLACADEALYAAKHAGRNQARAYREAGGAEARKAKSGST